MNVCSMYRGLYSYIVTYKTMDPTAVLPLVLVLYMVKYAIKLLIISNSKIIYTV